MLHEGNQIHNFKSSSGSGTVINYGSGSDFLTSYGSGSTRQKVTVPTVPVPQHYLSEVRIRIHTEMSRIRNTGFMETLFGWIKLARNARTRTLFYNNNEAMIRHKLISDLANCSFLNSRRYMFWFNHRTLTSKMILGHPDSAKFSLSDPWELCFLRQKLGCGTSRVGVFSFHLLNQDSN